jgi:fructose-1,6-bisphosphatase-3
MDKRNLLHKINYETGIITIDGKDYVLKDSNFPTVDPADPYAMYEVAEEIAESYDRMKAIIGG